MVDKNRKKLTGQQEKFCQEYILDFNATQAAIRAKYSKKTAYSQGQRLLKHVEVNRRIEQLKKELRKDYEDRFFERVRLHISITNSSVKDFIEGGKGSLIFLKDFDEIPDELWQTVKGFKVVGNSIIPEFWDKHKSADYLHKIFGEYKNHNEQKNRVWDLEQITGMQIISTPPDED